MFGRPFPIAIAAVVAVSAFLPSRASACLCLTPACGSILASDHLFEATVESIGDGPQGSVVVRLSDVRAVVGTVAPTLVFGGDGASCSYQFTVGVRYLIDAREFQPGRFSVSNCSHTKPLAAARGLLEYRARRAPAPRARVFGRVATRLPGDAFLTDGGGPPVGGARVSLHGALERHTTAGENGEFSFGDVPDGAYELRVEVPSTRSDVVNPAPKAITIDAANGCVDVDVVVPSSAEVRGHVVDESGRPAPGVLVELFPAPYNQWAGGIVIADVTGADGRFTIARVPPGRYVGGVGVPYPSARNAVAPALVGEAEDERSITIAPGESRDVGTLVARAAPRITVSGLVTTASGVDLSGLEVVLQLMDGIAAAPTSDRATIAPDGRFTIEAHRGVRYRLLVESRGGTFGDTEFVAGGPMPVIRLRERR